MEGNNLHTTQFSTSAINQCRQIAQQLIHQTQQSNQMYKQMLQQEQQNAQMLEQLMHREHQAVQVIQQSLQGHEIAIQRCQELLAACNQMEQSQSVQSAFTTGFQQANPNPAFHVPTYQSQQSTQFRQ